MKTLLAIGTIGLGLGLSARVFAAVIGDPMPPYDDRPDDRPREHVVIVTESPAAYEIAFRGTVDGAMTRMPVGYAAFEQGWQPNRSVTIENVGTTDVHNPWIVVGGRRNGRTLDDVVAEATRAYTAPGERARAIWEHQRRQRFHACTWDAECSDAVKVLNVYGYTLCGNEAHVINDLWKAAGLVTRRGRPVGHVVCEVFYDSDFHLLDSDEHVVCLERDNRTIASCAEVVRDHDLIKRTHTYGILHADDRKTDEFSASLYVYEGKREGDFGNSTKHSMDLTLRPGESLELRCDHVGKEYSAAEAPKQGEPMRDGLGSLARWGPRAYRLLRNGKLRYRPDLSSPSAERGIDSVDGARLDRASATIGPARADAPGKVAWRHASPYVFVGGKATAAVRLGPNASAEWRYSADGNDWQTVATASQPGDTTLEGSIDAIVSPRRRPTYGFWMQLVLAGDARARDVAFDHDVQTSALGFPELEVGDNPVRYTDANGEARRVRITHRWLERAAWHPPGAPAAPIAPPDGATVPGTRVAFRWSPADDPDGDEIVDYHFELSEHADMRWPLSPNFEKLTSRTASRGRPEWTVPYVGLLNPAMTYYWRVRARDATGVWGPWSATFRFQAASPGVPLDVTLVEDGAGFALQWRRNPEGTAPVAYKVYGSDERGFTASDVAYLVNRGKGFCRTIEEYENKPADAPDAGMVKTPANLIARTDEPRLRVVGPGLDLPNANTAYYRVAAVDAEGIESGPSDYAEVPRPFVVAAPEWRATLGKPFRQELTVIRSLGDLRCRPSAKSSYNAAFWDHEQVELAAAGLPEGLSLDAAENAVGGVPQRAGSFAVVIEATDQSGKSRRFSYRLAVEKSE